MNVIVNQQIKERMRGEMKRLNLIALNVIN